MKTECYGMSIGCIVVGVGREPEIGQSDIPRCVDRPNVVVVVEIEYCMELVEIDDHRDLSVFG